MTKWTNQPWETPSGRTVFIAPDEEPHEVDIEFRDGTHRWLHYVGDFPTHVRVDGTEFVENDDDLK